MGGYKGIYEIVLEVQDIERAEAFYRDVLGIQVLNRSASLDQNDGVVRRVTVGVGNRSLIGLWLPQEGLAGGRGGAHVHYALFVDPKHLERVRQNLAAHEVPIKFQKPDVIYFQDPDGHVVELGTRDQEWLQKLPQ